MRLGGASYAGRRDTDAGAGALGVGVVRDADTTCSAEEGEKGAGRDGAMHGLHERSGSAG